MMKRSRTLSSLESELLSISELYSPKNRLLISKNSWSELSPKNKQKERRKTTGSINLKSIKKKFNLKKIFFDFITTDFDRSLKTNKENMRNFKKVEQSENQIFRYRSREFKVLICRRFFMFGIVLTII